MSDSRSVTAREAMGQVVKWHYAMSMQNHRIVEGTEALHGIQREVDLHFFLIALANFVAFVKVTAKLVSPESRTTIWAGIEAFDLEVPDAGNLRDILEHYDEYIRGKGKLQAGRLAKGQRARIVVSRTAPQSHAIMVQVPGFADLSVDIEAAVSASNTLESVIGHALETD
jgi:hypothetical protein